MPQVLTTHLHRVGVTRRELIQIGYSGLVGIGLPSLLAARARPAATDNIARRPHTGRAKSVLLIFLTGGASHIDTFDAKPDAPVEIRGPFRSIATTVPGLRLSEHLPRLAARASSYAVVRTLTQTMGSHDHAGHLVLTGIDTLPPGAVAEASRSDWPCYAAGVDCVRPRQDLIPSGVTLPTFLNSGYPWPGQNAGVLGARHDPWHVKQDPGEPGFRVEALELPVGLRAGRLHNRQNLLAKIDCQRADLTTLAEQRQYTTCQHAAFAVLTSSKLAPAFVLEREPDRVRQRYGSHSFGQTLLLARRLIEAGVPVVQANMGMAVWDTHVRNCHLLKNDLLPPLDQAVAALLDDFQERGLLEETLVVMVGEFGRTPKMGGYPGTSLYDPDGRDHWPYVFFAVFAGAGIPGGQVIGRSDKRGAFPATKAYLPSDLGATIYSALGVDPESVVHDRTGRPLRLNQGSVIRELYS